MWIALQFGMVSAVGGQSPTGSLLRGRVIDARTAAPLRDVGVTITAGSDTLGRAVTDSVGAFQMTTRTGPIVAHFVRLGFRHDSIATTVGEFPLRVAMVAATAAVASALNPVVVRDTALRTGFQRRAARGTGGSFISAADIAKRKPTRTSDLLRSYSGFRIYDSSGVTQLISMRGTRTTPDAHRSAIPGDTMPAPNAARRCVLRIALDGHLVPTEFSVDDVRPEDVMGIEIYNGAATMPAEFASVQHDAPCGLIMIWTKVGSKP